MGLLPTYVLLTLASSHLPRITYTHFFFTAAISRHLAGEFSYLSLPRARFIKAALAFLREIARDTVRLSSAVSFTWIYSGNNMVCVQRRACARKPVIQMGCCKNSIRDMEEKEREDGGSWCLLREKMVCFDSVIGFT